MRLMCAAVTASLLGLVGISVHAQAVEIQHTAPECLLSNSFPKVIARLSPLSSVANARVFYRVDEAAGWCSIEMKSDAPSYSAVLPRAQGERLEYYIQVVDRSAGESRSEPFVTRVVADRGACGAGVVALMVAKPSVPSCDGGKPAPAPSVRTASQPKPEARPETKANAERKPAPVKAAAEARPKSESAPKSRAASASETKASAAPTSAPAAAAAAPAVAAADKPRTTPRAASAAPAPTRDRRLVIGQVDPACLLSNGMPRLGAVLTSNDEIRSARVYFRRDEAATWCHVDMWRARAGGWSGVLPQEMATTGLQYYIWAADKSKKEARTADFSAPDLDACAGAVAEDVLLQPATLQVRCGDDPVGGGGRKAGLLLAGLGALGGGAFAARGAVAGPTDTGASDAPSNGADGGRGAATSPVPGSPTPGTPGGTPTPSATTPPPSGCGDSISPATAITTPQNGQTISLIPTLVQASASDNVGVERVEFFAQPHLLGAPVGPVQAIGTATSSPYRVDWTPSCVATYRLYSRAFDACGNSATSAEIEVFLEAGIAPPCTPNGGGSTPTPTPTSTPEPTVPPTPQPTAPTPEPTLPPTPVPTVPPVGPIGNTGGPGANSVALTSELSVPAASAQILLNGMPAGMVNAGVVQIQVPIAPDGNRVEALLVAPGREAGLWRFDLRGRQVTAVLGGDVVRRDRESIVFRLNGRAGERVAFLFR